MSRKYEIDEALRLALSMSYITEQGLREYLFEIAMNVEMDDCTDFIRDALWSGCRIDGYKNIPLIDLCADFADTMMGETDECVLKHLEQIREDQHRYGR